MKIESCVVIGAGGTSQFMLPGLLRMLKYHQQGTTNVVVYDGDQFEEHNIERQIGNVGSKAEKMNQLLQQQLLPPVCKDQYVSRNKLENIRNRDADKDGVKLIVAAVDNDATRKMCIDVLNETNGDFIFITPGNSDASEMDTAIKGNVLIYGRVDGQQLGINPALLYPNIETPQDAAPRKGSCLDNAVSTPQLIAANALAGAWTLTIIQNILDDMWTDTLNSLMFNGRKLQMTVT